MINEQTILQAATSEKNAGDFPKVVQGFKELGVTKYQFLVEKGVYVFWDEMDNQVEWCFYANLRRNFTRQTERCN